MDASNEKPSINVLNDDCIYYIFKLYHNLRELHRLKIVCKRFNRLVDCVYHGIRSITRPDQIFYESEIPDEAYQWAKKLKYSHRCENDRRLLHLTDFPFFMTKFQNIVEFDTAALSWARCNWTEIGGQVFENTMKLTIRNGNLHSRGTSSIEMFLRHFPRLKCLEIYQFPAIIDFSFVSFPYLEHLVLESCHVKSFQILLNRACEKLISLKLSDIIFEDKKNKESSAASTSGDEKPCHVVVEIKKLKNLESLDINETDFSGFNFDVVTKNCKKLRVMKLGAHGKSNVFLDILTSGNFNSTPPFEGLYVRFMDLSFDKETTSKIKRKLPSQVRQLGGCLFNENGCIKMSIGRDDPYHHDEPVNIRFAEFDYFLRNNPYIEHIECNGQSNLTLHKVLFSVRNRCHKVKTIKGFGSCIKEEYLDTLKLMPSIEKINDCELSNGELIAWKELNFQVWRMDRVIEIMKLCPKLEKLEITCRRGSKILSGFGACINRFCLTYKEDFPCIDLTGQNPNWGEEAIDEFHSEEYHEMRKIERMIDGFRDEWDFDRLYMICDDCSWFQLLNAAVQFCPNIQSIILGEKRSDDDFYYSDEPLKADHYKHFLFRLNELSEHFNTKLMPLIRKLPALKQINQTIFHKGEVVEMRRTRFFGPESISCLKKFENLRKVGIEILETVSPDVISLLVKRCPQLKSITVQDILFDPKLTLAYIFRVSKDQLSRIEKLSKDVDIESSYFKYHKGYLLILSIRKTLIENMDDFVSILKNNPQLRKLHVQLAENLYINDNFKVFNNALSLYGRNITEISYEHSLRESVEEFDITTLPNLTHISRGIPVTDKRYHEINDKPIYDHKPAKNGLYYKYWS